MDIEQTNSNHSEQDSDIQKRNIIEEMNALNQRMQNPSNEIYKISSSWDKHSNAQSKNIEIIVKEMMNYIIKMDKTLTKMDTALTKMDTAFTKMDATLTKMDTAFAKIETAYTNNGIADKRGTKLIWF
ncbi:MAG: hypothetical protein VB111_04325 [Clostridiaceae bacterium]|nr:hypothetical protein [Clostridiaceae bacterium]